MPANGGRNWVPGALTVFFAHSLWVALVLGQARAEWLMSAIIVMSFVTSNSAGLGAFLTALRAPEHGLLTGLLMAPLAAVMAVVSNLTVRLAGVHIEISGFREIVGLFAMTMVYGFFVAAIGGLLGLWMRRRNRKESQMYMEQPRPVPVPTPPPEPPPLG